MSTHKYQVGDIVQRPSYGYREIRGVSEDSGQYTVSYLMSTIDRARTEGDNTGNVEFIDREYILVERPTPPSKFQVGDIIVRFGTRYRRVLEVLDTQYRVTLYYRDAESARISPTSCTNTKAFMDAEYTLHERAGDNTTEEVKDMSNDFKFKPGDVVRYTSDHSVVRQVLAVDPDRSYPYTISGNLTGNWVSSTEAESQGYLETYYELVASAPASEITDAHKADMATLSGKLAGEARRRGWCNEYQGVINGWNADLNVPLEPYPTQSVTTTQTMTITLTRTDTDVDGGANVTDHAHDTAYSVYSTAISVPGWTVTSALTESYQGTAV